MLEIRPSYSFEVSCQLSVPQAIVAFLESNDYESAVRLAVSLGGDSDTQACIAGAIAVAFYKEMPAPIIEFALACLPLSFRDLLDAFNTKFGYEV